MRARDPRGPSQHALRVREFCARASLDEPSGLLYVSTLKRIHTVVVPTRAERLQKKYAPVVKIWALAQQERVEMIPAASEESAEETRAREAVRRLMRCPIVDILQRALSLI